MVTNLIVRSWPPFALCETRTDLNEAFAHALNGVQLHCQLVVGMDDAGALHDGAYLVAQRH